MYVERKNDQSQFIDCNFTTLKDIKHFINPSHILTNKGYMDRKPVSSNMQNKQKFKANKQKLEPVKISAVVSA